MAGIDAIKKAIIRQHQKDLPLMDVQRIRQGVLDWLRQIRYPLGSEGTSWEDDLRVYPQESGDKKLESGLKIRLGLTLNTCRNAYLISIMECFAPDSRGVYILSAYANWQKNERRLQESLDRGYLGRFEDVLRARHTVWAQTFRENEIDSALDACARALLGNELTGTRPGSSPASQPDAGGRSLSHNNLPKGAGSPGRPRPISRPVVPLKDFPTRDENSEL